MNNKENALRIGPLPKIRYLPAVFLATVQTYVGKYHVQYRFEKATENWVYNRGYSQTAIVDFTTTRPANNLAKSPNQTLVVWLIFMRMGVAKIRDSLLYLVVCTQFLASSNSIWTTLSFLLFPTLILLNHLVL